MPEVMVHRVYLIDACPDLDSADQADWDVPDYGAGGDRSGGDLGGGSACGGNLGGGA